MTKFKKLEKLFQSIDPINFWNEVAEKVSVETEKYRHARAKSKKDAHRIFYEA